MRSLSLLIMLPLFLTASDCTAGDNKKAAAMQVFEDRIMPIFKSEKPSSCVQCHLSSVDLKDYILPSHTQTFVALRENGLIDVDDPGKSKILKLIRMGTKDPDPKATRIHARQRNAEYEAFAAWIEACCSDPELRELQVAKVALAGPKKPLEVVRHTRRSRLVNSFARNIYSQRMRCFPCHTPGELDPNNPKHQQPIRKHAEMVEKYGDRINIFQKTPEATLDRLIASSRRRIPGRLPLINVDNPTQSLLVLKPTAKLPPKADDGQFEKPSSKIPVSHMGGLKMHVNDQSYKGFVAWIEDYARVTAGTYTDVADLPADNWIPTQRILRMTNVPDDWPTLSVVQLFIHRPDDSGWDPKPVGFVQGLVTPRHMLNGPFVRFREDSPQDTPGLRPGRYLVRVYRDTDGKIAEDPAALLNDGHSSGEVVINAKWRIGFKNADVFSAADLTAAEGE